jgi:prephenate dehydratase
MKPFQFYSAEEVINYNLQEISRRYTLLGEQELAHLQELACEMLSGVQEDMVYSELLSERKAPAPALENVLPIHRESIKEMMRTHDVCQNVFLCRALYQQLLSIPKEKAPRPDFLFHDSEEEILSENAKNRVIYQKSSYTDSAYLRFASLLKSCRAAYAQNVTSVCHDVYNGVSEYCILPIENSTEGLLNSFAALIVRYELKIIAVCDISSTDGSKTTRFALLRKQLSPLLIDQEKPHFLEFSVALQESPSVSDLLSAAQLCGLKVNRIHTTTSQEQDTALSLHAVFTATQEQTAIYMLYLSMEAPQFVPIGFYQLV